MSGYSTVSHRAFLDPEPHLAYNLASLQGMDVDGGSLSSLDLKKVPKHLVENVTNLFSRIIQRKDVQKQVQKRKAENISISLNQGMLGYRLDSGGWRALDQKVTDEFLAHVEALRDYARRSSITLIKDRDHNLSRSDRTVLSRASLHMDESTRERMKNYAETSAEWALYAAGFSDLSNIVEKTSKIRGEEVKVVSDAFSTFLGWAFSGVQIDQGIRMKIKSDEIADKEGTIEGETKTARGLMGLIGSCMLYFPKVVDDISGAVSGKLILSTIPYGIFSASSAFATINSLYKGYWGYKINRELDSYLDNNKLTEKQRVKGALLFLQEQVELTKDEVAKIIKKIRAKNPNISDEEFKTTLEREKQNRLIVKTKRFERRSDGASAKEIQEKAKDILKKIDNRKTEYEGIKEAKALIASSKKTIKDTMVKNILSAIGYLFFTLGMLLLAIHGACIAVLLLDALSSVVFGGLFLEYLYQKFINKKKDQTIDNLIESPAV